MDRLGGITPKTLSVRLRELEDDGIVAVDQAPGRREVWYRVTPAGADLAPVIDGLSWWGLRHAWRQPQPGEPLHPEHLLRTALRAVDHTGADHAGADHTGAERADEAGGPARWHFRVDGGDYLAESDGAHWTLRTGGPDGPADVTITATTQALAGFIFTGAADGVEIEGAAEAAGRFRRLIGAMAAVVGAPA